MGSEGGGGRFFFVEDDDDDDLLLLFLDPAEVPAPWKKEDGEESEEVAVEVRPMSPVAELLVLLLLLW